jgi:hypothetical protein
MDYSWLTEKILIGLVILGIVVFAMLRLGGGIAAVAGLGHFPMSPIPARLRLSLVKMLSAVNVFEISDIQEDETEPRRRGGHCFYGTMLHSVQNSRTEFLRTTTVCFQ